VNCLQDNVGALSKHFKCWKDPSIVSECLSSKLKTCCIRGYKGTEFEFGLAKYIMQHSKVLETITIKCAWLKQNTWLSKRHMRLKLSSCTMGSTTCKLLFYWRWKLVSHSAYLIPHYFALSVNIRCDFSICCSCNASDS
jgi:hypothetical protein